MELGSVTLKINNQHTLAPAVQALDTFLQPHRQDREAAGVNHWPTVMLPSGLVCTSCHQSLGR